MIKGFFIISAIFALLSVIFTVFVVNIDDIFDKELSAKISHKIPASVKNYIDSNEALKNLADFKIKRKNEINRKLIEKRIHVFHNGYHTNGIELDLTEEYLDHGKFGELLSPKIGCKRVFDVEDVDPSTPCRVFSEIGIEIKSANEVKDGDMVFLVPPDMHFIWPTIEIGRKMTVPHVVNPSGKEVVVETLSIDPRVYQLYNFFNDNEADNIIRDAMAIKDENFRLKRSSTGTKDKNISSTRTSENAFVTETPTAINLQKRIFSLLGMEYKRTWADGLQVLRYNVSKGYNDHYDYLEDSSGPDHNFDSSNLGTNRFATVVLYFNDVEVGGETVFSFGNAPDGTQISSKEALARLRNNHELYNLVESSGIVKGSWEEVLVGECQARLAVKPFKGNAVLFYNQHPDGRKDMHSKHGACPVLKGQKWAANLWVWNGPRYGYTTTDKFGRTVNKDKLGDKPFKVKLTARNIDVPGAELFYKGQFWKSWDAGTEHKINSYYGHEWSARVEGKVIKEWRINQMMAEQTILLAKEHLEPSMEELVFSKE